MQVLRDKIVQLMWLFCSFLPVPIIYRNGGEIFLKRAVDKPIKRQVTFPGTALDDQASFLIHHIQKERCLRVQVLSCTARKAMLVGEETLNLGLQECCRNVSSACSLLHMLMQDETKMCNAGVLLFLA